MPQELASASDSLHLSVKPCAGAALVYVDDFLQQCHTHQDACGTLKPSEIFLSSLQQCNGEHVYTSHFSLNLLLVLIEVSKRVAVFLFYDVNIK